MSRKSYLQLCILLLCLSLSDGCSSPNRTDQNSNSNAGDSKILDDIDTYKSMFEGEVVLELKKSPAADKKQIIESALERAEKTLSPSIDKYQKENNPQMVKILQLMLDGAKQKAKEMLSDLRDNPSGSLFDLDLPGQLSRIESEGGQREQSLLEHFLVCAAQKEKEDVWYEEIKKNPPRYAGRAAIFRGRILEISERDNTMQARLGVDGSSRTVLYIAGNFTTNFTDGDRVSVIGYLAGEYTYTSQANWTISIPALAARKMMSNEEYQRWVNETFRVKRQREKSER